MVEFKSMRKSGCSGASLKPRRPLLALPVPPRNVLDFNVAEQAGADLSILPRHEVTVRGRGDAPAIPAIGDARDLPEPAAEESDPRPANARPA